MIVPKQKIIEEYNRIYNKYPNNDNRVAAVSVELGVHTDDVVETIKEIEVEA